MNFYTNKQIFYINSFYRTSQTDSTSDFSIVLPIDRGVEYDSVVLIDASVPKSNHTIHQNSTFDIVEETKTRTILIPYGNYNRRSFRLWLQRLQPHKAC